ncbi:hypothetical protein KSW81_003992 [Nannochloris sp. 'desiccata']|nr:hypothetical protein KSW81_003992 [Chlorella desiccata (nom. nud.)]
MYLPSADKENQENHLKSKTSSGGGGVPLGGVVVAGALTVGAGIVKLVQRHLVLSSQLETTQSELRHTTSQLSELSDQLDYTKEELTQAQSELETSVTMLEQRTKELAEERFALEAARGELGLTQNLSSYESLLDKARMDLDGARSNTEGSPGGFWAA